MRLGFLLSRLTHLRHSRYRLEHGHFDNTLSEFPILVFSKRVFPAKGSEREPDVPQTLAEH